MIYNDNMKQLKTTHPLYQTWSNMRQRCSNPNNPDYKYYGERGVKICKRWTDFWKFVEDMGERPEGRTLDRIDNKGDYKPSNCKWSTHSEQNYNRRFYMTTHVNISDKSESAEVPVRRKNTRGATTVAVSMTIPIELNKRIEADAKATNTSKSLLATELMLEAYVQRDGQKG